MKRPFKKPDEILKQFKDHPKPEHPITLELIKEELAKLFTPALKERHKQPFGGKIGRLTDEEIASSGMSIMPSFLTEGMGPELYHIGQGVITGKGGWDMFQKALRKEADNYIHDPKRQ